LAAIKRDAELRRIPVVILTTSDSEVDRGLAYDNWVNSYLVKPVDFRQFRQMITDMDAYWSDWNRSAI
jgi:DNA-binding response OmpR family regulator